MTSTRLQQLGRRLRVGMVGGGNDSVIGATHRVALRADGLWELVAGSFSIDPDVAVATAREQLVDPDRTHMSFEALAEAEAAREDRIDAVVIATPPSSHARIAKAFLERGFHVICEKPMSATLAEAREMVAAVEASGRRFVVTHCYSGFPMVRHARAMVARGDLGEIRIVEGEFAGGEPALAREPADPRQRHWRYRSDEMGRGAILGEVGSHLHHMVSYVTGLQVTRVGARMDVLAERRDVYDNVYLNVDFDNGAVGRLWNSYQAVGSRHGLRWRIYGTEASLAWDHESPEVLVLRPLGGPAIEIARASSELAPIALESCRFSVGHSEGYGLAYANIYRDFGNALLADAVGDGGAEHELDKLPSVEDGLRTLELVDAVLRSQEAGGEAVDVR